MKENQTEYDEAMKEFECVETQWHLKKCDKCRNVFYKAGFKAGKKEGKEEGKKEGMRVIIGSIDKHIKSGYDRGFKAGKKETNK